MSRRRKQQSDQRADLRGGGFIGLPVVVHRSEASRSLSPFDRAVMVEFIAEFNGYNNGKIVISQRQIAERLGTQRYDKISRSIAVLIERGLLDISTESVWKERRAREYRLTFITTGSPPYVNPATNEYLHWKKNDAEAVSAEKGKSAEAISAGLNSSAEAVSAGHAGKPQKCVNGSNSSAEAVSSLIVKPYQGTGKNRRSLHPEIHGGRFAADAE